MQRRFLNISQRTLTFIIDALVIAVRRPSSPSCSSHNVSPQHGTRVNAARLKRMRWHTRLLVERPAVFLIASSMRCSLRKLVPRRSKASVLSDLPSPRSESRYDRRFPMSGALVHWQLFSQSEEPDKPLLNRFDVRFHESNRVGCAIEQLLRVEQRCCAFGRCCVLLWRLESCEKQATFCAHEQKMVAAREQYLLPSEV